METLAGIFTEITKRDGRTEPFDPSKIREAIRKAFAATETPVTEQALDMLASRAQETLAPRGKAQGLTVELVQDAVEQALMEADFFPQAKAYILYRSVRQKKREERERLLGYFPDVPELGPVLRRAERDFPGEEYSLGALTRKFLSLYKREAGAEERWSTLVRAAIELTDIQAAKWEMIAGRIYSAGRLREIARRMEEKGVSGYREKMAWLDREGLLDPSMLQTYSMEELEEAYSFIDPERDLLLPYSGLELLYKRYVVMTHAL
ncbi:MAG TPA: ATP cone domain-containing protein, partial [Candidatus Limnocylindria bacterium]|nr:ATP cone domain-containing protein [Candidatus Limnocylindria bacterium]